jgi:phage FluMu protein Com
MVCSFCKKEIPSGSFKLYRNEVPEEIECPSCKILNDIYMARCRANNLLVAQETNAE